VTQQPYPPAPPPREAWRGPSRIEPVPGTAFGVAYIDLPPVASGMAVGSLVAGIASLLVSMLVGCFGLAGAQAGWGGWVAGAFAVLASLLGLAAIGLGLAGVRQIRRARAQAVRITGGGLAIAGVSCGAGGVGLTVLLMAITVAIQLG
jgi:hypothetical protein